jgi:hypothetical protein
VPKHKAEILAVEEMLALLGWMPKYRPTPKSLRVVATAVAAFVDDRRVQHEDLGEVVPLEWLIQEITATREFFPQPIVMRRIYETRFTPLDGRSSGGGE